MIKRGGTMNNKDIRQAIKEAGLRHWQVAECYGINEGNFSRLLRKELGQEKKEAVFSAIEEAKSVFIK